MAARRGHPEIALGNVLGSNVFNVGMVLGIAAAVKPLPIGWAEEGSAAILAIVMAMALGALLRFRGDVGRLAGLALLLTYSGYMVTAISSQ